MNDIDPTAYDPSSEARRDLREAVENEKNIVLASGNKILTLDQLENLDVVNEHVLHIAERYEWPTEADEIMDPIVDLSPDAFLDSLKEVNSHGELQSIGYSYFYSTLEQDAVDLPFKRVAGASFNSVLGTLPVVHRANAVAPDLFASTREVLRAYRRSTPLISKTDEIYTELIKPKNSDVVLAISMCYRIMGRLVTVNDGKIWRKLWDQNEDKVDEAAPWLNADEALRNGGYL